VRKYLSTADVADELKIIPETVREMIQRGDLPAIAVGPRRIFRIAREDLDAYIERCRVPVSAGGAS